MKFSNIVALVVACVVLPACGKSKVEQCNAFVDRATKAQSVVSGLKLDSDDSAVLDKGASTIEAEAKSFATLELKDEKLIGFRTSYADTLNALGKIMHDLSGLQKDAKDPSKAAGLEAEMKKVTDAADKVTKQESDLVDQLNAYCTGSK